jgi:predicted nucleic acid-binding protein
VILVDTSVWIDHFRRDEPRLIDTIERGELLVHPFVIGEVALGSLRNRVAVLGLLLDQPSAPVAMDAEVLALIEGEHIHGSGIGYVDAHLLAASRLAGAGLWTRDRKLHAVAEQLGVALRPGETH